MDKSIKQIIIFLSGAAIGSLTTWFLVKKTYEVKADAEINEVRHVFEDRLDEIEGKKSTINGDLKGPETIDDGKKMTHKEIIEKLNNKPDLLDYTKFFKANGEKMDGVNEILRDAKEEADLTGLSEEELAEMETPPDDEPYTSEEEFNEQMNFEDYKLNGASKDAIANDKSPYEIEPSDFELTCSNYEKTSLVWYHFDQILSNEEGETVDEKVLVGDVIKQSGFDNNDLDVLYVRNDKIMADYEITKIYEAFRQS